MSSPEAPADNRDAFERRAEVAVRRRRMPTDSDTVIPLPDLSSSGGSTETAQEPQMRPNAEGTSPEARQYFTILPGEVPEAPEGGDYTIDENIDTAAAGVFTYAGRKLRPVTPTEYQEITAITANADLRRERGPRRLATLNVTAPATPP